MNCIFYMFSYIVYLPINYTETIKIWVEIIESPGDLNVTKRELEIAPEDSLFPIKFCADTSNISDDSKWAFGILQKTSNKTVFELRNLIQVKSKKCLLP